MIQPGIFDQLDEAIRVAPPEERPGLVVALAARLAQLGAGLAAPTSSGNGRPAEADENLSTKQAARRLGMSADYLYRHADKLPFTVKIGRRVLFSARGLEKWNRQRTGQRA